MIGSDLQVRGPLPSIVNTTSTGAGTAFGVPSATKVAMQVVRASTAAVATQVKVEGSIDGDYWTDVIAAASYTSTGTDIVTSTGNFIVNKVRAVTVVHTATGPIDVTLTAV